jgi:hypothetical protein
MFCDIFGGTSRMRPAATTLLAPIRSAAPDIELDRASVRICNASPL